MKKNRIAIILATLAMGAATPVFAAPANVRALSTDTITDNNIIFPASFETDTHKMLQNWYLNNYAVLDRGADNAANVVTTDQEYIERLQKMPTVIEMPFNQVVKSYIEMYTQRKRQLVETMLGMSLYYMPIFEQALDKYGLPMELRYLPIIESALNPNAVSPVGATGLWQFMLETAKGLGLEVNSVIDQRRDPIASSDAAARYLKQLYNTYNDWSLAIAAYNCGPGNVNKALRRAGEGKKDFWEIYRFLPRETRGYVPGFIAANYAMNYYDKHNISPALASRPIITDTVHVNRRVHFQQIADVMGVSMDELRILNPQYRTEVIPGDIKPYSLMLPNIQAYCYVANEDSIVNHNAELYARREVVEPATGDKGQDEKGEYVEELTVKYHKVRKGETIASIAKRYGISASELKSTNKLGKSVRVGQNLKINTYKRRYLPTSEVAKANSTDSVDLANNDIVARAAADTHTPKVHKENPAPRPTSHTVAKGDNLSNISAKYGVEISDLKDANNLSNDNIQIGQTLTIPAPGSTVPSKARRESVAPQQQQSTSHTVAKGDNLSNIAAKYGVDVNDIKDANGLSNDNIQAGQTLTIPGASGTVTSTKKESAPQPVTHTVAKGETLGKIADKYGVGLTALKNANGLRNNNIQVGQKLTVPVKGSTAKASTSTKKASATKSTSKKKKK